jgi:hypothetical protein
MEVTQGYTMETTDNKTKQKRRRRKKESHLETVAEEQDITLGLARGKHDSGTVNQLDVLVKNDYLAKGKIETGQSLLLFIF